MPGSLGPITIVLMLALVLARVIMLRRRGTDAFKFGQTDRKDFLIPPFAALYFYTIFAAAFDWPLVSSRRFYHAPSLAWCGAALCALGILVLFWSLVSFGRSFRVGIDADRPDALVTTGVFAYSRNPIYVAFAAILPGQFLLFPNWIPLLYLGLHQIEWVS